MVYRILLENDFLYIDVYLLLLVDGVSGEASLSCLDEVRLVVWNMF